MRSRERLLRHAYIAMLMAAAGLLAPPAGAQQDISVTVELEQLPGVTVTAPSGENGTPGETVYYLFWLQNTGDVSATYRLSLEVAQKWAAVLPHHGNKQVGPLEPGAVEIVPVAVTIASDAEIGSTGATMLTATANEKPRPSDYDTVITTVVAESELPQTVVAPPGQSGAPGEALVYEFEVRNVGVSDAVYRLRLSSSQKKWSCYLPAHPDGRVGPIAPDQVEIVPLVVEIPVQAAVGTTCDTTLRAIRLARPRTSDEDSVTTTVVAPSGLVLSLSSEQTAQAGDNTVVCRAAVANSSGEARQVLLTARSTRGWRVEVDGRDSASVEVPPGKTITVALVLKVPRGQRGERDYLIVTAQVEGGAPVRLQVVTAVMAR